MEQQASVPVDQIPGITFHVEASSRSGSAVFKARGRVQLTADIADIEMWEEVVRRLEGFKVYSVDDFYQQIMLALRHENERLTYELARVTELRRTEGEQAAQRLMVTVTSHDILV